MQRPSFKHTDADFSPPQAISTLPVTVILLSPLPPPSIVLVQVVQPSYEFRRWTSSTLSLRMKYFYLYFFKWKLLKEWKEFTSAVNETDTA